MEYVMIPVPEQFQANVDQYLRWNVGGLAPVDGWEEDAVRTFLHDLDESARTLILVAADASVDVTVLTVPVAAERAGCSVREALGMVLELNDAIRLAGGPAFSLATDKLDGMEAAGPEGWTLNMPGEVAKFLLRCAGRGPIVDL